MYASFEGQREFSSLNTIKGQFLTRNYTVTILDGKLSLQIGSAGGAYPSFALNGLQAVYVGPPGTPPPANQAPTDLTVSGTTVSENAAAGTLVGSFTTVDPNVAVVGVPDERLEAVAQTLGSSKVVPETVQFSDIADQGL